MSSPPPLNVAILDDYAGVALASADWGLLDGVADIAVFHDPLDTAAAADRLRSFDILCTMRERMAMPAAMFEALPRLKLVTIVGRTLANLDQDAATRCGVLLIHPGEELASPRRARFVHATPELAWGLVIAVARGIVHEDRRIRRGEWRSSAGMLLAGRTLGLLGLGATGRLMAEYGRAFGMRVIAWSENLTVEAAQAAGAERVDRDVLFAQADVLSIHLQLSRRTHRLVGARELGLMKRAAILINTSRGAIIDEDELVAALERGDIAGAGLDVFEREPLRPDHPLRGLENVTLTPHIGYATPEILASFYRDMPEAILAYARGSPVRILNKAALDHPKHRWRPRTRIKAAGSATLQRLRNPVSSISRSTSRAGRQICRKDKA